MLSLQDDTSNLDPVAAWAQAHDRVCALVLDLAPEESGARVPATPDWTVRDLLSHVVGVGADVVAGEEDPDHAPWWTQKHVAERAGRDVAQLVDEWRGLAPDLTAHMRAEGARPLADLTIHEQDLRGAVGRLGAQENDGLVWVTARMLDRAAAALEGGASLALVSPAGSWTSDGGPVGGADVELSAPAYDLARALTTRRTRAQLQSWTTRGELDDVIAAFTLLGPLPEAELPC